jgi:ATP-dependent helicase/nuclease subunit A
LEKVPPTSLPGWIGHKLPIEKALPRPLSPSGAQTLIDERLANESDIVSLLETTSAASDGLTPAKRGTLVHLLLQVLPDVPPPERREVAVSYLKRNAASASQSVRDALLKQTFDVLDNPDLSPWFDPAISRAEVPVMGKIELASGLKSVSGTIDRLVVSDERVVLLDYKTSAFVPQSLEQVSKDYITQMALYRHLVHLIYPDKFIDTVLIWTQASHGPMIMQLPTEVLDQAYCEIAAL